jgi:hypothetical protein
MTSPTPRWSLIGSSTNDHGVKFLTVACRDAGHFNAVETGELAGPYSVHKYVSANGLYFGIILDWPDWLDLYARDQRHVPGLETLVAELLEALNQERAPDISSVRSFRQ